MKTKKFIITALLTACLSAQAQDEQIIEAVSATKQAELHLLNNPKLVIDETELTFTDRTNSTVFSKNERLVIRIKKEDEADGIAVTPQSTTITKEVIYSIDGKRQSALKQGLNIVRQNNRVVKKIVVK